MYEDLDIIKTVESCTFLGSSISVAPETKKPDEITTWNLLYLRMLPTKWFIRRFLMIYSIHSFVKFDPLPHYGLDLPLGVMILQLGINTT